MTATRSNLTEKLTRVYSAATCRTFQYGWRAVPFRSGTLALVVSVWMMILSNGWDSGDRCVQAMTQSADPQIAQETEDSKTGQKAGDVGMAPGDMVAAWEPIHVTGPEAGTRNCPVCTHLEDPVVLVFAKWNRNTESLAIQMNQWKTQFADQELKSFLIVTQGDRARIQSFAQANLLLNLSICVLDPSTRKQDLDKYQVDPERENTLIVYRDFTVFLTKTNLVPDDYDQIEKKLEDLFQQPRLKQTRPEGVPDGVSEDGDGKAKPEEMKDSDSDESGSAEESGNWLKFDRTASSVTFVGKSGSSFQEGQFENVYGKIQCPSDDPEELCFEVSIDMASTTTKYPLLTEHLKGEEFFDVAKFPTSRFTSTKIIPLEESDKFQIHGRLELHGVAKPIQATAQLNVTSKAVSIRAEMMVQQSKFGMDQTPGEIADNVPVKIRIDCPR